MENKPDRSKYKFGIFYFNPEDENLIVPKSFGWGWTLNFAKPLAYVLLLISILTIVLITNLFKTAHK